jgi:hypothetical protein
MSTARRFYRGASAIAIALAVTAAAVPAADAGTRAAGARTPARHIHIKTHKRKAHPQPKRALPGARRHMRDMKVCAGGNYWEHWSPIYEWYSNYGWQGHVTSTTAQGAIVDQWRIDYYWYWRDSAGQWHYGGYWGSGC